MKVKIKTHSPRSYWPAKIFVLAVCLSLLFGIFAELILTNAGIAVSCVLLIFFISISVLTDMIGVAATAANADAFISSNQQVAKHERGVKEALHLIKNADKVASLVSDVIGDVCGILSGACGAAIVLKIAIDTKEYALSVIVASFVSAIIAGLTILFKALGKKYSIKNANKIIHLAGKVLSFFMKTK